MQIIYPAEVNFIKPRRQNLNFFFLNNQLHYLFEAALFTMQFQSFPPHIGTLAFVILATSYSTSIWLILHILSGWAIKYVPGLFSILNVEKRPIRAIGAMCIAIVWIVGVPTATLMGYKYSDNYFPSTTLSEQTDTTEVGQ